MAARAPGRRKAKTEEKSPVPITTPEIPRFELGSEESIQYLKDFGYVVLRDVLAEDEVQVATDLYWNYMENLDGYHIKRSDPATWNRWPGRVPFGIFYEQGAGQSEFLWYLRCRPRVKSVFSHVWETDRLLTSFDGCAAFRPWELNSEWKTKGGWWHVDQSTRTGKIGMQCVQGLIALTDASAETGGLCVIPKSHLEHEELCARNAKKADSDFVRVASEDPALRREPAIMVSCRAGDFVLWDSRTIHCSSPSLEPPAPRRARDVTLTRLVGYVCMTPRDMASAAVIEQRKRAFARQQTTNHWPHIFAANDDPGVANRVEMTPEVRALVGYDD